MTPLQRKSKADYLQSRAFIDTVIIKQKGNFNPDADFNNYVTPNGRMYSPEAATDLNNRLKLAKQHFENQNIDLAAYVAETIKTYLK